MKRVEVDFDVRCSMGHVRARVPFEQEIYPCQQIEVFDSAGKTAVGKVMQVSPVWSSGGDYKLVHFHVDTSSYGVSAV